MGDSFCNPQDVAIPRTSEQPKLSALLYGLMESFSEVYVFVADRLDRSCPMIALLGDRGSDVRARLAQAASEATVMTAENSCPDDYSARV